MNMAKEPLETFSFFRPSLQTTVVILIYFFAIPFAYEQRVFIRFPVTRLIPPSRRPSVASSYIFFSFTPTVPDFFIDKRPAHFLVILFRRHYITVGSVATLAARHWSTQRYYRTAREDFYLRLTDTIFAISFDINFGLPTTTTTFTGHTRLVPVTKSNESPQPPSTLISSRA